MTRLSVLATLLLVACSANNSDSETTAPTGAGSSGSSVAEDTGTEDPSGDEATAGDDAPTPDGAAANVTGVTVTGEPGNYSFSVTLASPDTGCDQYANWWEVLDEDGALLYRRILGHSHVDEQPFTRSGGPVDIAADQVVFVRGHMDPGGYGGGLFTGTPEGGFEQAEQVPEIDAAVESADPQPTGCAF